jgi:hypothetical protein
VLKKSHEVVDKDNLFETNSYWLEKILHSGFIDRILPAAQTKRIRTDPAQYQTSLLEILYLYLFEKLILSGQYDDKFNNGQIGDTLEQVFGQER